MAVHQNGTVLFSGVFTNNNKYAFQQKQKKIFYLINTQKNEFFVLICLDKNITNNFFRSKINSLISVLKYFFIPHNKVYYDNNDNCYLNFKKSFYNG